MKELPPGFSTCPFCNWDSCEDECPSCGSIKNSDGLRVGNTLGKPQLSYCVLGQEVIAGEAKVWEHGANKYARGNWLKGMSWTQCSDSILRHLTAFLNGQDLDEESGLPHVDHLVCAAKILSNSYHTRKDRDDRETKDES